MKLLHCIVYTLQSKHTALTLTVLTADVTLAFACEQILTHFAVVHVTVHTTGGIDDQIVLWLVHGMPTRILACLVK